MILLSFDIEEFDMPFEYGKTISFEDQMSISIEGTSLILDLLEKHQVKATFFSTVIFAINAPEIIKRIIKDGHEIASHSYYHSDFKVEHLLESKEKLEEITNTQDGVWQIPASVSPIIRFPLFWLSFHNLPLWLYKILCNITFKKDKYLNIYFHPWEFTDLKDFNRFGFPSYVSKNSGIQMYDRLDNLIIWMKKKNYSFHCTRDLIEKIKS